MNCLTRNHRFVAASAVAVLMSGCGGLQQYPTAANAVPHDVAPANRHGTGNIYWNRIRRTLYYPAKRAVTAKLSYWGPDGYYTNPVSCHNGGSISAKPGTPFGNPQAYMHVIYSFKAQTPGPDHCYLLAVLNNTGSPPFSAIQLRIEGK